MRHLVVASLLLLGLILPSPADAQQPTQRRITIVTLTDGTTVKGRYIQRIPAGVIIRLDSGRRVLVDGDRIRRIRSRWVRISGRTPPRPHSAQLDTFAGKTRLDLGFELGANTCLSVGGVDCVGRTVLPRGRLSLAVSVGHRLMFGLDLSLGGLSPPTRSDGADIKSDSLLVFRAVPTAMFLAETGRLRFTMSIGAGYGVLFYKTEGVNAGIGPFTESREESGAVLKTGLSLGGRLNSMISLSLQVEYIYQTILSACVEQSWDTEMNTCSAAVVGTIRGPSESVALHMLTVGLLATFSFGL